MSDLIYKRATNISELNGAFAVRREVFVYEQNISEDEEYDGLDNACLHYIARNGDTIVGTARVRFISKDCIKIERMAVLPAYRRQGFGTGILDNIEEEFKRSSITEVILHAQMVAVSFYKACGFQEVGEIFYEAGIEHVKMQKKLVNTD